MSLAKWRPFCLSLNILIKEICWLHPQSMRWGGCFTNVLWALQNILSEFVYCRYRIFCENFKLKLRMCAQSHAWGTCTKFQLEIRTINVISSIVYFHKIILESLWHVIETTSRSETQNVTPTFIMISLAPAWFHIDLSESIHVFFYMILPILSWTLHRSSQDQYESLLGFVRTRVLMSRSRLNNEATHGGWHFDIHRDFDTRGR